MEPGARWAAPDVGAGAAAVAAVPLTDSGAPAIPGQELDLSGIGGPSPSTGIAVARGDATAAPKRSAPALPTSVHGTRRDTGDDPAAGIEGNPLLDLGPVGPGAVLDGAFDLLRFRFGRLVALCAVVFVPVQMVDLALAISTGTDASSDLPQVQLFDSAGSLPFWATMTVLILQGCALFLLGMAAGVLTQGWLDGHDLEFRDVVGAVARRSWVVPIVVIIAGVAKWAAACFGLVGFFLVDALLFIAAPLAAAERLGPFASIGRSMRLTRAAYGNALAICFGGFLITSVVRMVLAVGPIVLVQTLGLPEGWFLVIDQVSSLTLLVTLPLTACIAARASLDLRCRAEGLDLFRRQDARGLGG